MSKQCPRFFKTKAFTKLAAESRIEDVELLRSGSDLTQGKGISLGDGVWKKRLNKNMHRSIVIEKAADWWFFIYLYAKNDRENITRAEEAAFKLLATQYAAMNERQLDDLLATKEVLEIGNHGDATSIQERCIRGNS